MTNALPNALIKIYNLDYNSRSVAHSAPVPHLGPLPHLGPVTHFGPVPQLKFFFVSLTFFYVLRLWLQAFVDFFFFRALR